MDQLLGTDSGHLRSLISGSRDTITVIPARDVVGCPLHDTDREDLARHATDVFRSGPQPWYDYLVSYDPKTRCFVGIYRKNIDGLRNQY